MKALFCQDCGDIVAPLPQAMKPRYCLCSRHAVWWLDPRAGVLRVCDLMSPDCDGVPSAEGPRAFVLGFTNRWLQAPDGLKADDYKAIIEAHDDYYLFKRLGSVAVRIRPGESGDTRWAALPSTEEAS
jgi:hypothetical protein